MKKTAIILCAFLLGLVACNNQTTTQPDSVSSNSNTKLTTDTTPKEDTLQIKNKTSEDVVKKLSYTDSLLLNPFDLYKFKRKVGQSNSGGAGKRAYRFKPEYDGLYYAFFIFSRHEGYLGTRKQDTLYQLDGLKIVTYKPLGKYQNEYFDPTEELIEVEAKLNNFKLPELAFVGLKKTEITKRLGLPTLEKNNCLVYTYADRVLILKINNDRVSWLRYAHLKSALTDDKGFDKLYSE
ncbi:MAG: hypothetical protein ACRCYO_19845 [Bacteroidia bacterium]